MADWRWRIDGPDSCSLADTKPIVVMGLMFLFGEQGVRVWDGAMAALETLTEAEAIQNADKYWPRQLGLAHPDKGNFIQTSSRTRREQQRLRRMGKRAG
jgi:hypothetical protein